MSNSRDFRDVFCHVVNHCDLPLIDAIYPSVDEGTSLRGQLTCLYRNKSCLTQLPREQRTATITTSSPE